MAGPTAIATSGGSSDVLSYPVETEHPIDNLQDVEEAIEFANEALDAAQRLEDSQLETKNGDKLAERLLNVAVENYIERFSIPAAALESDEPSGKNEASRLKKIVLYLYAIVERIFKSIFDFFRNQKLSARKIMNQTRDFIGRSDSLSSAVAAQLNVKDRSLMVALHIDGIAPKKTPELFDQLASDFEKQYDYSAVNEIIRLVTAAKDKNLELVVKEAQVLRSKLEAGLKATLESVDPQGSPAFQQKKADATQYYSSTAMFGQNYIYGMIGDDVTDQGKFSYRCGIRRDAEIPLRVGAFPVLAPDEIRHVCRTAKSICENVIRFSREEELLQKVLREATFLTTKEADKSAVAALTNIAAVGQNSYIVHLRFVMRTTQAIMRWCAASIKRYESVGQNG